jgi:hypothetical protein
MKNFSCRLCFCNTNIVFVQALRRQRSCTRSPARAWCTWWRRPAPPATSPSATATSSGRAAGPQRDGTGAAAGKPSLLIYQHFYFISHLIFFLFFVYIPFPPILLPLPSPLPLFPPSSVVPPPPHSSLLLPFPMLHHSPPFFPSPTRVQSWNF